MTKVQVTIDIPDGWELAESEMRLPKRGECFIIPDGISPPNEAAFDFGATKAIILKKKNGNGHLG